VDPSESRARIAAWQDEVDAALDAALPPETAWPATLHRAARYSLFAGGKRIRPLLALAACEAVGGDRGDALPFACALEMVHTFSLIHDDLPAMDDDDMRRGRPTCHKVFGEAMAILAGDALLTQAFRVLTELPAAAPEELVRRRLRATTLLGGAVGTTGLIGGQVDDIEHEGRAISPEALERMHRAKTGALIEASVRGGALLGGADAEALEGLGRAAAALGLAFQVVDDVLDATEPAERLGKTAGKDAAAKKATWVSVHGLEAARGRAGELLDAALAELQPFGERAAALQALARRIVERRS
jgi:geranylgeranyl diphosphate synthase, type II